MTHRDDLRYERNATDPSFATWVEEKFVETRTVDGGVKFTGPCPRCHGTTEVLDYERVYKWRRRSANQADLAADDRRSIPATCECGADHPGHPDGWFGCGASWKM